MQLLKFKNSFIDICDSGDPVKTSVQHK